MEGWVVEAFSDEQDGVGSVRAGFDDLIFVDDEIFAEDGQGDRVTNLLNVLELALEEFFIGEATDGGGSGAVVGGGDGDGIEIFADEAGRG